VWDFRLLQHAVEIFCLGYGAASQVDRCVTFCGSVVVSSSTFGCLAWSFFSGHSALTYETTTLFINCGHQSHSDMVVISFRNEYFNLSWVNIQSFHGVHLNNLCHNSSCVAEFCCCYIDILHTALPVCIWFNWQCYYLIQVSMFCLVTIKNVRTFS